MFPKRHKVDEIPRCSFCSKTQDEVDALISNPFDRSSRVCICNECVEVCNAVLDDYGKQKSSSALRAAAR